VGRVQAKSLDGHAPKAGWLAPKAGWLVPNTDVLLNKEAELAAGWPNADACPVVNRLLPVVPKPPSDGVLAAPPKPEPPKLKAPWVGVPNDDAPADDPPRKKAASDSRSAHKSLSGESTS
jgi:hypothetical protein